VAAEVQGDVRSDQRLVLDLVPGRRPGTAPNDAGHLTASVSLRGAEEYTGNIARKPRKPGKLKT
jgi:hypothetical protein